MKQAIRLSALLFFLAFALANCGKGGDGSPSNSGEANLVIGLDPDPGSPTTPVRANGPSYSFNVIIKSAVPPQGVSIKVDYVKDSGGAVVFTETKQSTTATTSFTITNIPFNEVGTVTVVVTSVSKPSNTTTQTFKLVRK